MLDTILTYCCSMLTFVVSHTAQEPTMAQEEEMKTLDSQPVASDVAENDEDSVNPIQQVALAGKTCQDEDSAIPIQQVALTAKTCQDEDPGTTNPVQQVTANHTSEKEAIAMHCVSTSVEDSTPATKSILKKRGREESDPVMTVKRHLTSRSLQQVQFSSITVFSFATDLGAANVPRLTPTHYPNDFPDDGYPLGMTRRHWTTETFDVPAVKEEDPPAPIAVTPPSGGNAPKHKQTIPRVRYVPLHERSGRLFRARVDQDEIQACNEQIFEMHHFRNIEKRQFAKEEKEREAMKAEDKTELFAMDATRMAHRGNSDGPDDSKLDKKRPAPDHQDDSAAKRRKRSG
ncbi:hypothetical protein AC1031_017219 [Aphanomyces cochlioides]|nr:hypothetical protein AC1031_017219 [Aphanomyces cochlioides]